jgi:hypothetical protein
MVRLLCQDFGIGSLGLDEQTLLMQFGRLVERVAYRSGFSRLHAATQCCAVVPQTIPPLALTTGIPEAKQVPQRAARESPLRELGEGATLSKQNSLTLPLRIAVGCT